MANFFSADYWKALYFKAIGGQETAVDPNAMRGTFAGSATWTGTASAEGSSVGDMSGSFAGSSSFAGDLRRKRDGDAGPPQRKKRPQIAYLAPSIAWLRENARNIFGNGPNASEIDRQIEELARQERENFEKTVIAPAPVVAVVASVGTEATEAAAAAEIVAPDYDDDDEIIALLLAA